MAIAIIREGQVLHLRGYGHADREHAKPVTTKTVFNWASNSKPLAAVAAMQLVESGALKLDEDVRHYVPEFPDKGQTITIRHLLCHQSGIPHYHNGQIIPAPGYDPARNPPMNPVVALDKFNQSPLLFKPGEKYSYSSYAYILLSAAVEKAGKKPLLAQIKERIAIPMKMKSLQLDVDTSRNNFWATAYKKNKSAAVVLATLEPAYWKQGAGGYKSNVDDFARFAEGLINRRLVSEATEELMWQPQKTTDGHPTDYGLGFSISDQGGLKVSHNGEQTGARTRIVLYPRAKHGIVVMCNCGFADVDAITTAIYAVLDRN